MAVDEIMLDERAVPHGGSTSVGTVGWQQSSSNKRPWEASRDYAANGDDDHHHHDNDDDMMPARKRQRCWTPRHVVTPPHEELLFADSSIMARTGTGLSRLGVSLVRQVSGGADEDEDNHNFARDDDNEHDHHYVPLVGRRRFPHLFGTRTTDDDDSVSVNDQIVVHPPVYFPVSNHRLRRPLRWGRIVLCLLSLTTVLWTGALAKILPTASAAAVDHIILPSASRTTADLTLRDFLLHPQGFSLGMAPAFFGFYGYFGSLAAWEQAVAADLLQPPKLRQVAGASAGAMAAILLAAGVSPLKAAEFCSQISLPDFADFPGVLAVFKGQKFEEIMEEYLDQESTCDSLLLQDAKLPVAVSAFDLQTMAGRILTTGSMARAARASATFPLLFQPVGWTDANADYTLIDGGLADAAGVAGLVGRNPGRVVNLKISPFWGAPPTPSDIPGSTEVVSISLQNLPQPGPLAMELGPVAVEAARKAMMASLDVPLYKGKEENHYELHIDASSFWN